MKKQTKSPSPGAEGVWEDFTGEEEVVTTGGQIRLLPGVVQLDLDELVRCTSEASWAAAAHDKDVTSMAAPIHFLSIFASAEYYSGPNPGYPINIAHRFATRAEILPCNILIFF